MPRVSVCFRRDAMPRVSVSRRALARKRRFAIASLQFRLLETLRDRVSTIPFIRDASRSRLYSVVIVLLFVMTLMMMKERIVIKKSLNVLSKNQV